MSRPLLVSLLLLALSPSTGLAQTISFLSVPQQVGAGLQSGVARARLSNSQHGGVTLTLAVNDSTLGRLSANGTGDGRATLSAFLPNGSIDLVFAVQGMENTTGSFTLTATAAGFAPASTSVQVVTPAFRLNGVPATLTVPASDASFTVTVGVPNAGGTAIASTQPVRRGAAPLDVLVAVDDPTIAELVTASTRGSVANLTIAAASSSTPASVPFGGVALDGISAGTAEVTAQIAGFLALPGATTEVTIGPAALSWVGLPVSVGAGLRSPVVRARLNGSAHGGVTVRVESLDPARALLARSPSEPGSAVLEIPVPNGAIDATFYVDGLEANTGVVGISATCPGWTPVTDGTQVVTPAIDLVALDAAQDTLDPADDFYARVGLPNAQGTGLAAELPLRVGGPGSVATFTLDDAGLAILQTLADSGDTVQIDLAPGTSRTPISYNQGGVRLDALAPGTVRVAVNAPGFGPLTSSQRQVVISAPSMSWIGLPLQVGSGLVDGPLRVRLGATQHGGTTVRVTVADSTRALLSRDITQVGTTFVEGLVPNGSTDFTFYVHGLEGMVGHVGLTATAMQFPTIVDSVEIVQPAVAFGSGALGSTIGVFDLDATATAQIGAPILPGTNVRVQRVRPGGSPVEVSFSVSDSTVGRWVSASASGAMQAAMIQPGQSATPNSVASGGVAFDPLAVGSVVVSARVEGFLAASAADRSVQVLPTSFTWFGTTTPIGAGLQSAALRARLSDSQHGGLVVRLTSADPSRILLSADPAIAGDDTLDVFVPNGSIDAVFWAQALDDTTGAVEVHATSPNVTSSQTTLTIATPAVDIVDLITGLDAGSPVEEFSVRVGVTNANNLSVQTVQARRAGAAPLVVTVESSTPAVAELVTLAGAGSSLQVEIAGNASVSPQTVSAGGMGVRALSAGTSILTASIPGFIVTGAAQREVSVSNTGIVLAGVPALLGARLQTPLLTARLTEALHGGVTLRIASGDSTVALVASGPTEPGRPFVDYVLANGQDEVTYVVQGREGGSGPISVIATAGAAGGSVALEIVEPALQIVLLADSVEVGSPADDFLVQTGIAKADGTGLAQLQRVRAGAGALAVSVTGSAPAVGDLLTAIARADSLVIDIPENAFQSATTRAQGGIAFDATGSGTTTIAVTATGFAPTASALHDVVVFGDVTSVPAVAARVVLEPNVPNPFNPATTIRFSVGRPSHVRLVVHDVRGRKVRTLLDELVPAGAHDVRWAGEDDRGARVASGVYLLRLTTQEADLHQKMVLVE